MPGDRVLHKIYKIIVSESVDMEVVPTQIPFDLLKKATKFFGSYEQKVTETKKLEHKLVECITEKVELGQLIMSLCHDYYLELKISGNLLVKRT